MNATVQTIFEEIVNQLGFGALPNFFRYQEETPKLLQTSWGQVKSMLVADGVLTRLQKELILIAVSRHNHCTYCEQAHLALCGRLGYEHLVIDDRFSARTRAMVDVALLAVTSRDVGRTQDLVTRYALTPTELHEIACMTAVSQYLNTIAETLRIPLDPMIPEAVRPVADHPAMLAMLASMDEMIATLHKQV